MIWFTSIVAVAIGFVLLVWAADRFVVGAAATADNLGVSSLVIGLTVVGFGTSAPEMIVAAMAAASDAAPLAMGNALGSNVANFAMVLGAAALVTPMDVQGTVLRRELPILFGCMLLATGLVLDGSLDRLDGVILAVALVLMMAWIVRLGLRGDPDAVPDLDELPPSMSTARAAFWLILGLVLLLASSKLLVWGATNLARAMGVGDLVIGLSVVAIGTSLPELAASVMAAKKGEHDLAVGNVVGSNIFNILGVLALPGLIAPGAVPSAMLWRDIPAMFFVTLLFVTMARFFRRPSHISRFEGGIMLLSFVGYLVLLFLTQDLSVIQGP